MSDFKQLSREQLKRITGGSQANAFYNCGVQAGGALCPDGQCCGIWGYCGTGIDYCAIGCGCQAQCISYCA